ncbi:MAG: hypothetical protein EXS52_02315 [Candidatus Staskawiczbacteria bacterium]|nr:hypothetical protein [Candidatus Staskawiczbacteria bacterium]
MPKPNRGEKLPKEGSDAELIKEIEAAGFPVEQIPEEERKPGMEDIDLIEKEELGKGQARENLEVLLELAHASGVDFESIKFENLSEKQKNLARRQVGLPDRLIKELEKAVREKDALKIRRIQDSMRPMREIDFHYLDILRSGLEEDREGNLIDKQGNIVGDILSGVNKFEGPVYDEDGKLVDENWKPPASRKKFGER